MSAGNHDDIISVDNISGDILLDHPYENTRYEPPPPV